MDSNTRAFQMTLISMITSITSALDTECSCSVQFDPVCATNGEVFTNECMLKCYNSENHSSLEVEKAGHCDDLIAEETNSSMLIPENSVIGGAADVCLFTRDYDERFFFNTRKEEARKSRHYFHLLVLLCSIECAVLILTQMFVAKQS